MTILVVHVPSTPADIIKEGTHPVPESTPPFLEYISINIIIERCFYDIYLHHKPLSSQSRSHLCSSSCLSNSIYIIHHGSCPATSTTKSCVCTNTRKQGYPVIHIMHLLLLFLFCNTMFLSLASVLRGFVWCC